MADEPFAEGASKSDSTRYPKPLVRSPLSGNHRQTFILLHGRGSNAPDFGPDLLASPVTGFGTLLAAFPDAKFIFPTASKRRAKVLSRCLLRQWFDCWLLDEPEQQEELQNDGLRETSEYLHRLLRKEVEEVGAKNVVLGGLSQGCAASLVALLLWEGEPLAACVGMCGWLPYCKRMQGFIEGSTDTIAADYDEGDDIFQRADEGSNSAAAEKKTASTSPVLQAIEFLREETELPMKSATVPASSDLKFQRVPVFLGHGTEDGKVPLDLGQAAAACLRAMNVDVDWKEYLDLGHWYSGSMLLDVIIFLRTHTGWQADLGTADEETDSMTTLTPAKDGTGTSHQNSYDEQVGPKD